jgi:hypothetical protein
MGRDRRSTGQGYCSRGRGEEEGSDPGVSTVELVARHELETPQTRAWAVSRVGGNADLYTTAPPSTRLQDLTSLTVVWLSLPRELGQFCPRKLVCTSFPAPDKASPLLVQNLSSGYKHVLTLRLLGGDGALSTSSLLLSTFRLRTLSFDLPAYTSRPFDVDS